MAEVNITNNIEEVDKVILDVITIVRLKFVDDDAIINMLKGEPIAIQATLDRDCQ